MVNRIVLNTVSYHGSGAVKEIGPELSARGFKKALICSGKHVVKSGETLSGIFWAKGCQRVAQLNHLANPNLIYPGQRLRY